MSWEALAVVVALIAALISLRSYLTARSANERANRALERANEIQEALLALEEQREQERRSDKRVARLGYELDNVKGERILRLVNHGPGIAGSVRFEYIEPGVMLMGEVPLVIRVSEKPSLPYVLVEGADVPLLIVAWQHPTGETDELRIYLE